MVKDFVQALVGIEQLQVLHPRDWFLSPHDSDGLFLWAPPPAIAEAAVFQMAEAMHIRPWNTHVFICPSLMMGHWERMLNKACDIVVTLPFGPDLWPKDIEHEPLTLAIAFPLLNSAPWRIKRSPLRDQRDGILHTLQRHDVPYARSYLRELWLCSRKLEPMPSGLACPLL
jgi:hypothetical protein